LEWREPCNAQRDIDLCLRRRLRNGRMGDVADLTGAMRFIVRVAVVVDDNLRAQNQYRQDQR
jgi:hypothetical protein